MEPTSSVVKNQWKKIGIKFLILELQYYHDY